LEASRLFTFKEEIFARRKKKSLLFAETWFVKALIYLLLLFKIDFVGASTLPVNMEEWKPIEDFPEYEVSNLGRVKSLNYHRSGQEQLLKQVLQNGYLIVCLHKDKIQKNVKVHRLVVKAFLPNPENKRTIDHINRNKQDNRLENLRWATHSENCLNKALGVSGERLIYPHGNSFQVLINRQDHKVYKSFKTLEEAIAWRDQQLNLKLTTMNSSS
jgi:hypothetical protein